MLKCSFFPCFVFYSVVSLEGYTYIDIRLPSFEFILFRVFSEEQIVARILETPGLIVPLKELPWRLVSSPGEWRYFCDASRLYNDIQAS